MQDTSERRRVRRHLRSNPYLPAACLSIGLLLPALGDSARAA